MAAGNSENTRLDFKNLFVRPSRQSRLIQLSSSAGADQHAQTLSVDDDHYLKLRLVSFHHPATRKGWTKMQPVVYAYANWNRPLSGDEPFAKIITPSPISHPSAKTGGAMAFRGRDLFGHILYRGTLNFSLGMLVRRSNKAAREGIELAATTADYITQTGLLELPVLNLLPKVSDAISPVVKWLLPDDDSEFLVGSSWDLPGSGNTPNVGTWALLDPDEDISPEDVWLDATDNKLKSADGAALNTPYIVYSVEASGHNPDRSKDPELAEAWRQVDRALSTWVDDETVQNLFQIYARKVRITDALNEADKDALIEVAERKFKSLIADRDRFTTESIDSPELNTGLDLEALDREFLDSLPPTTDTTGSEEAIFNEVRHQIGETRLSNENTLNSAIEHLAQLASHNPGSVEDRAIKMAISLRSSRLWSHIERLEFKLRDAGLQSATLLYFGAAASLEQGDLPTAEILAARSMARSVATEDHYTRAEVLGLLGRVWKQKAVDGIQKSKSTAPPEILKDIRRDVSHAIRRSMTYYLEGDKARHQYEAEIDDGSPHDPFHLVNMLGLIYAARAHEYRIGNMRDAKRWAKNIIKTAEASKHTKPSESDNWHYANVADAYLFLGKRDKAAASYANYLEANLGDAFALNGTRRNLVDLWQVDPGGEDILGELVRDLAIASLASGSDVALAAEEVRALAALSEDEVNSKSDTVLEHMSHADNFESVIEGGGFVKGDKLLRLVQLGQLIGKVCRPNGDPVGTGFLVKGEDLHSKWSGKLLFMTNDHVLRDVPFKDLSVSPEDARIFFEQIDKTIVYQADKILWRSDATECDCAIVQLHSVPNVSSQAFTLAKQLPPRWRRTGERVDIEENEKEAPRIFIMGHADGKPLQYSMYNNFMIDHEVSGSDPAPAEPIKLHYSASTLGGSSGSPVLLASTLELIGLHHKGVEIPDKPLNDCPSPNPGPYEANKGHWIQSIRAMINNNPEYMPPEPLIGNRSSSSGVPAGLPSVGQPKRSSIAGLPSFEGVSEQPVGETPNVSLSLSSDDISNANSQDMGSEPTEIEDEPDFWENAEGEAPSPPPQSSFESVNSDDWRRLKNKPTATWPAPNMHPDTYHLPHHDAQTLQQFELNPEALKKALAFASIPISSKWGSRVLFGIRGALPIDELPSGGDPVFQPSARITETIPNHSKLSCTIGVWDLENDQIWITPASTVPAVGYMWRHTKREPGDSNVCNLMPPGVYRYKVGCHRRGASSRQAGSFIQASKLCVLRNAGPDLEFSGIDRWDWDSDSRAIRICDNIHGAIGGSSSWAAEYYSAGCQVIPGFVKNRDGPNPQPTGQWAEFRVAAGLSRLPVMKRGSSTETTEDGTAFTYILLTAREVSIAAGNLTANDFDPRFFKLRRGSKGDAVKALQSVLGINEDGDFGYLTQRALLKHQQALKDEGNYAHLVDGIVTTRNCDAIGLTFDNSEPASLV